MLCCTRQEQSWQRSVGCGNRSPLKQSRPLNLQPSQTAHVQPSRAGCGHDTAGHRLCTHTTSPLCGDKKKKSYGVCVYSKSSCNGAVTIKFHSLSRCSPGTLSPRLEAPVLQRMSHLGSDSLHTQYCIHYLLNPHTHML